MADPTRLSGIAPKDPMQQLADEIRSLRADVQALQTARSGNATVIDGEPGITVRNGGGITVGDGGALEMLSAAGTPVVFLGTQPIPDGSGRTQQVFEIARDDGTVALSLGDFGTIPGHAHRQDMVLLDRAGNTILADDAVSGVGIARPHLSQPHLADTNIARWPATTAATFTNIAACFVDRQNALLGWTIIIAADGATTGQFQLLCNGHQIGTTQSVTGSTAYWTDSQPWPSDVPMFTDVYLVLQARVTAGTGQVYAQCQRLRGDQS